MHITRIYSDENGDSRFEDLEISLKDQGAIGLLSTPLPVHSMVLREVAADYDYDFHNAPQRQYILLMDGSIEIETSLGEKRIFKGGDIILAEDTTGKGHRSRNLTRSKRKSVFITL
ncbi:hypothetical protein GCM10027051_04700 [Niabella terrae]